MQLAAELADVPGALGDLLLAPPVRHRAEERDQRRRSGQDHLLVDALLDQRRVLLERCAEERLARQEHDHEVGRVLELAPVALGAQLADVVAHLACVIGELRLARDLVLRLDATRGTR